MERAPYFAVAAGLVVTLAVGLAIAEGVVLSVSSMPVSMLAGLLAGSLAFGVVLIATAGRRTPTVQRQLALAAAILGVVGLVVFLGASSMNVSNAISMAAGLGVGGLLALATFLYLRHQDSDQVKAVTM